MGTSPYYIPATAFTPAFILFDPADGINPAKVGSLGLNAQDQVVATNLPSSAQLAAEVQYLQASGGGVPSAYGGFYAAVQAGNASIAPNSSLNVDGILMTTNSSGQVVSVQVGTTGTPNFVTGTPANADSFTLSTASASAGLERAPTTTLLMNASPVAAPMPFTMTSSPLQPTPESNPFSTPAKTATPASEEAPSIPEIPEITVPPVSQSTESIADTLPEEVPIQASQPAVQTQVLIQAKPLEISNPPENTELKTIQPQQIAQARASSMPAAPTFPMTPPYMPSVPQHQNGSAQLNLSGQGGGQSFSHSGNSQMGFAQGGGGGGHHAFTGQPKQPFIPTEPA